MDEVGANTNQKGDGKIEGRLLVCAKGTVPQEKQHKRQTLDTSRTDCSQW